MILRMLKVWQCWSQPDRLQLISKKIELVLYLPWPWKLLVLRRWRVLSYRDWRVLPSVQRAGVSRRQASSRRSVQ